MGSYSDCLYLNGLSTSLPREAQELMVRSLPGFKEARIVMYGYAVEYSYFHHSEISDTLRLRRTSNVFVAGQICGTSGYEEAAGLGILAGTNAARLTADLEMMVPSRMESYIGVMVDDIVDKGLDEPYRMFSSRAENRLHLRQDNADRRLYPQAKRMGIVSNEKRIVLDGRIDSARRISSLMEKESSGGVKLKVLCRRPEVGADKIIDLCPSLGEFERDILNSVILDERYSGYIERSMRRNRARQNSRNTSLESIESYMDIEELCWEAREVLEREKPGNLGQAERLPGVRPSDIQGIIIHLAKARSTWNNGETP
jgi:tRNA uridine 5-carboxymethylaminomethyl modification enzyme